MCVFFSPACLPACLQAGGQASKGRLCTSSLSRSNATSDFGGKAIINTSSTNLVRTTYDGYFANLCSIHESMTSEICAAPPTRLISSSSGLLPSPRRPRDHPTQNVFREPEENWWDSCAARAAWARSCHTSPCTCTTRVGQRCASTPSR